MTKPDNRLIGGLPHLDHPEQFKHFKQLGFSKAFDMTYEGQEFVAFIISLERMRILSREQIKGIAMGKYKVVPNPDYKPKEGQN